MDVANTHQVALTVAPQSMFWIICSVILVGSLLLVIVASSGIRLLWGKTEELLGRLGDLGIKPAAHAAALLLERRNELWAAHAQLLVAVLVAVLLTVLLLTRVISAEAGLPILSGISGFALAKQNGSNRRDPEGREPDNNTPPADKPNGDLKTDG